MNCPTGATALLTLCRVTAAIKSAWAASGICGQSATTPPDSAIKARDKTELNAVEPWVVGELTL